MKVALTFGIVLLMSTKLMAASYEVPVSEDLKKFAKFELVDFKKQISTKNKVVISYTLPKTLTGYSQRIVLVGDNVEAGKDLYLTSEHSVAVCNTTSSTCSITYYGIDVNKTAAAQEIKKISKSNSEFINRFKVMSAFSRDPVGVIAY